MVIVEPRSVPIHYRKGPKGLELDCYLDVEAELDATNNALYVQAENNSDLNLHRVCFRFDVIEPGDVSDLIIDKKRIPFLKRSRSGMRGVEQYYGKVNWSNIPITVRYEISKPRLDETPEQYLKRSKSSLFIWLPDINIPTDITTDPQELSNRIKAHCYSIANEVAKYIEKHGRWSLSEPLETNWKPHLETEQERLIGGIANQTTLRSDSGLVETSNSDGRNELAVKGWDAKAVSIGLTLVNMPERIKKMEEFINESYKAMNATTSYIDKLNEIMTKQTEMSDKYAENFAKLNGMFGLVQQNIAQILAVQDQQNHAIRNIQDGMYR